VREREVSPVERRGESKMERSDMSEERERERGRRASLHVVLV
jgi:hypothetical protein